MSRRWALGSSGLGLLGFLSGSALGQSENKDGDTKKPAAQPPKEFQERMEKSKAFSERMRNAGSPEERQQVMNEQMAWQRQMAVDSLKDQLRISYRAAKERTTRELAGARQSLRQIMSLRQEAVLVLNGLLD
jgi:hypothetical protein